MKITRRTAIRNFVALSAGVVFIPSCLREKGKPTIVLKNKDITSDDEKLLAELCETIIPRTNTPGAKDIGAHLFALKMIDDCFEKEDQGKLLAGLQEINKQSKKLYDKSFVEATAAQRQELLMSIDNKDKFTEGMKYGYASVKKLTVQAYTTSQHYLTTINKYEMVPARFHGCVPVSGIKHI